MSALPLSQLHSTIFPISGLIFAAAVPFFAKEYGRFLALNPEAKKEWGDLTGCSDSDVLPPELLKRVRSDEDMTLLEWRPRVVYYEFMGSTWLSVIFPCNHCGRTVIGGVSVRVPEA